MLVHDGTSFQNFKSTIFQNPLYYLGKLVLSLLAFPFGIKMCVTNRSHHLFVQLTLEQHRFVPHRSIYMPIFFDKYSTAR